MLAKLDSRILEKVDAMKVGMFKNTSYWGKSSSVLKSGVCKYFRREVFDKFEWCVMEMMVFGMRSEGMLTNIVNRIKILVMEEIVDEYEKVSRCIYLLERMAKKTFLEKVEDMKRVCEIVKSCKKGRVVSYVNNWYKYNGIVYEDVKLDKVLKYRKKGDSEELLKLGERVIDFMEKGDEKVIDVYTKMYAREGEEGIRYRRKEGVYLFMEIVESFFVKDENSKRVFLFVLDRFHKKEMKERRAFGVWMGLMCLKDREKRVEVKIEEEYNEEKMVEYLFGRGNIEINEDYVVNDWHVDKKWGLGKFGRVGALVVNEELSSLGSNGGKYKEFYMMKKDEEDEKSAEKKVVKKEVVKKEEMEEKKEEKVVKKVVKKVAKKEIVDFDEKYVQVKVLVEGVCGLKKCCVIVEGKEDGEKYVLKEMSKSMNEGRDYLCMDKMKKEFGLKDMSMEVVVFNKKIELVDKKIKCWKDNYVWKNDEKGVVYCVMKYMENKGDLGKHKNVLKDVKYKEENLKIRLFDGLFRSSDNISRNILVVEDGLLSIDEGDLFGKRKIIFNKKGDVCKKDVWYKENYSRVIDEMWGNKEEKREKLVKELIQYGFGEKVTEFRERFDRYKEIVKSELDA